MEENTSNGFKALSDDEIKAAISAFYKETMQIVMRNGVITFEKSATMQFGRSYLWVLPPHGDLGCWCTGCELYRVVSDYRKKGWQAVKFEETSK